MNDLGRVDVADGQGVDGRDAAKDVHHLERRTNIIGQADLYKINPTDVDILCILEFTYILPGWATQRQRPSKE